MALASSSSPLAPVTKRKKIEGYVFLFDRRYGDSPEQKIFTSSLDSFEAFQRKVKETFDIKTGESFVITTTSRHPVSSDHDWNQIENGDTFYVLQTVDQELAAQAHERVSYLPHYDTIVKGGMYEYYASEGQNPLPFAFAELIDNALAATSENVGPRRIHIRLHLDDSTLSKSCIFVIDNGRGMTSHQLNNWAIYRLSKFNRREKKIVSNERDRSEEQEEGCSISKKQGFATPRSLNSDISYFGVGGKQAIFFIGGATRMISRPSGSKDVHELSISRDEFIRKERNEESIYSGYIRNRKIGDHSHLSNEDEILKSVVSKAEQEASFTCVAINDLNPELIPYLKDNVNQWTTQLAHIYHYYIHGPDGNTGKQKKNNIELKVHITFGKSHLSERVIDLRDIDNDMQSRFIQSCSSTFEFKAIVEGTGLVEGILRYHPFLYDKETYPSDLTAADDLDLDEENTVNDGRSARGRKSIFECFWNGRLIPYTFINEFDWCAPPKKVKNVPVECYNRVSGVLFTNDKFQVSTNKLTFIDLEMRLKDKATAYTRVFGKTDKRSAIEKEYASWLKDCHALYDKQVLFKNFQESITRNELPKTRQQPWGVYHKIEWDGKTFEKGQMVKISRTVPQVYGSIKRFLLFDKEGEIYATGGELEVNQEPACLYNEVRVFPLQKLDRNATAAQIKKAVGDEEAKLPCQILMHWPEGNEVKEGEKLLAGRVIGAIKAEISNQKGELISKLPGASQRKLLIALKLIWHSPNKDELLVSHVCQHGKSWPYWFRQMDTIRNLGNYTLTLQTLLNESDSVSNFAGKPLPSRRIRFKVIEGKPDKFTVGMLEGPFRIGVPFSIPLEFQDAFGHQAKATKDLKPTLAANGLELKYESLNYNGYNLVIQNIKGLGAVPANVGKSFSLIVKVPELKDYSQMLKIRMLPGPPHAIYVSPEDEIIVENGSSVELDVNIQDEAGNVTSQPKLGVTCKFLGMPGLPVYHLDCSNSGQGKLSGDVLHMKTIVKEVTIKARIEVPSSKNAIKPIERVVRIQPSSKPAKFNVFHKDKEGKTVMLTLHQDLTAVAGDVISGLTYEILDEAGRVLSINKDLASRIKVNWTPKAFESGLLKNCLPDIRMQNQTTESKFCNIHLVDRSDIHFAFNVKALAGEPASMNCRVNGDNSIRLNEKLKSSISVRVMDRYNNEIKKIPKSALAELQISADGLDTTEMIRGFGQVSGFDVEGIRFNDGPLGGKEVTIQWGKLIGYVRLVLVAGPPTKMSLPGWDVTQPMPVFAGRTLGQNLVIQLCDEYKNPSAQPNVRVQLARESGIRLLPTPQRMHTDENGRVDFGKFTVSGAQGLYQLQPKAFMGRVIISGPKLNISIQADVTKPTKLEFHVENKETFTAGDILPDFQVCVYAEDKNLLSVAQPSHLTLSMWPSESKKPSSRVPNNDAEVFYPDSVKDINEKDRGTFYFTKKTILKKTGVFCLSFLYKDDQHEVHSKQHFIKVLPGKAVQMMPKEAIGTPTVSNQKSLMSRSLIRNMTLELKDMYGNNTGEDIQGKVIVEVLPLHKGKKNQDDEVPLFLGNTSQLEIPLKNGAANITNVCIEENTPGKDGQSYMVRCTLKASSEDSIEIPTYDIPFLFYNDVKKQAQMMTLTRQRDHLKKAITMYQTHFSTMQQLFEELKLSLNETLREELERKNELRKLGLFGQSIANVKAIDDTIKSLQEKKLELQNKPRRVCMLQPAPAEKDVIGKIGHLAEVDDANLARVLSWHMGADMDCIITRDSKTAKLIYTQFQGKQQVLPIDSIYTRNLPVWDKGLPHEKIANWRPCGNPKYARNLLQFNHHETECRTVFGMLLGDTIILDTLDDGNDYRQHIVKFTNCPTILTREGDRIRSNGKFGGLMNKAPAIEKLRGVVFGEPLSKDFSTLAEKIEAAQNYKALLKRRMEAENELREQNALQNKPEMKAKQRECQEAEEQLRDIESKLGVGAPNEDVKPSLLNLAQGESDTPQPVKRARLSSSTPVVNGASSSTQAKSPAPQVTPTRHSTRRSIPKARFSPEVSAKRPRKH